MFPLAIVKVPSVNEPAVTSPLNPPVVAPLNAPDNVRAPLLSEALPSVSVVALTLVKPLTESTSPTVIVLLVTEVSISFDVPEIVSFSPPLTVSSEPLSAPISKLVDIAAVEADVILP